LIDRLGAHLRSWKHPPKQATLFGSTARGDGGTDSDIDILVVHRDNTPPGDAEVEALQSSAYRWTGNHAQLVVVSASAWKKMADDNDPLVASVRRDGIDLLKETEPGA
jgi:predicted nucleotidyltransferase